MSSLPNANHGLTRCGRLPALALFLLLPLQALYGNWPNWRGGADGSGITKDSPAPLEWSATNNVRWKIPLPDRGNSTPAVWGNRVFVTQALEKEEQRTVICFDATTGTQLWQKGVDWKQPERTHRTNPYCSASPTTDGERVIAWHGSAGIFAYDFTGRELWRRDLGLQSHEWGYGTSPILHGGLCILFFGPGDNERLLALDKKTGKTIWETKPPALQKRPRTDGFRGQEEGIVGSFATPIIADTGGRTDLIMTYPQMIVGYDPETGQERWRCGGLNELIYTSPIAGEGVVLGMGGFFGNTVAVRTGGEGDVTDSHLLWRKERTKNRLGSGVIHDGHVYILNSDGIAECIELKTGEIKWEERLPKAGSEGASWSSMLLVGELIYVPNQAGDTIVLKARPVYEVVRVNPLDNTLTNASLAFANNNLFIRTHTHLWCISPQPNRQ